MLRGSNTGKGLEMAKKPGDLEGAGDRPRRDLGATDAERQGKQWEGSRQNCQPLPASPSSSCWACPGPALRPAQPHGPPTGLGTRALACPRPTPPRAGQPPAAAGGTPPPGCAQGCLCGSRPLPGQVTVGTGDRRTRWQQGGEGDKQREETEKEEITERGEPEPGEEERGWAEVHRKSEPGYQRRAGGPQRDHPKGPWKKLGWDRAEHAWLQSETETEVPSAAQEPKETVRWRHTLGGQRQRPRPKETTPCPERPGQLGFKVTVLSLQLKDQYGPVFTVRLGPTPLVVLCAAQAVPDAFGGRADVAISEKTDRGYGIAFSQGERWRTLRRFALTTLRDLGLGRRSLEERIQEELGCLERELESACGTPFDPTFPIRRSTANIICSVVFGCRFHYQDEDFKTFLGLLAENLKQMDTFWVQAYGLFPALLRHLPGPHNRLFEVSEKQKEFMARVVKEHQDSVDTAQPRDFIDAFLIRMQQVGLQ
ncbi:Hypothetical predicted protein [Marmota monax]|uniref:Uncharacterized protein n=1 Tax=Marmota monax TaxID=9995 RepID=A0A5E4ADM6_MARMO|nr:Hypothetical predicted protein [Marmota monax]